MGKLLIIKGADFSANAIEHVTPPTPSQPIYTLQNKVYDGTNYDTTEYELFGSSLPNWTLFVHWSNNNSGSGYLWNFWGNSNNKIPGVACRGTDFRVDDTIGGMTFISDVNPTSDKIALRRTDNMLYYSLDGVTWVSLYDVSQVTNRRNLSFGARADGKEFGKGTIVKAELYNVSLSDISSLFE